MIRKSMTTFYLDKSRTSSKNILLFINGKSQVRLNPNCKSINTSQPVQAAVFFSVHAAVYESKEKQQECIMCFEKTFIFQVFAFVGTVISIICFPLFSIKKNYARLVNLVNMLCLVFHCTQWLIVSGLRYIYIAHEDWLLVKFPESTKIRKIALSKK